MMRKLLWSALILSFLISCAEKKNYYKEEEEEKEQEKLAGTLSEFKLEKTYNALLQKDVELTMYDNGNITGYLTHDLDLSSLKPSFKVENGELYIENAQQISGKNEIDFSKPVIYTLKGDNGETKNFTINLLPYTGLPVTIIRTENEKNVQNKTDWVTAEIKIDGMGTFDNYEGTTSIRGRGNTTWTYPKKPYNIKLDNKDAILGMPKHKRWSLLANYRDWSFLRNKVTFHIGQQADNLEWTPRSEFSELIFNGQHIGLYQITEHVRVDKNRVNITEMSSEDIDDESITGGYLLELEARLDEVNTFVSEIYKLPFNFKNPDEDVLVTEQKAYMEEYIKNLETALKAHNFETVYEYLDINSFIDFWIINALVGNSELKGPHSFFMYKKRNDKLYAGPLWDFDFTTFATTKDYYEGNRRSNTHFETLWYKDLFKDNFFLAKVKERFQELKPVLRKIPQYITEQSELISPSIELNSELWVLDINKIGKQNLNGDEYLDYNDAIERMIDIFNGRLALIEDELNKR